MLPQTKIRTPARTRVTRPRTPGWTYAVLSLALFVLVTTLALTSRQSAPPTIAEFAPQAVEQITAPDSSPSGSSAGVHGADETDADASRTQAGDSSVVDVARV